MLRLVCPSCMSEEDSFTQYGLQSVTINICSDEVIDNYEVGGIEIDVDALLMCNNCSREETLSVFQDTAVGFIEAEGEEGEEVETVASPSLAPSPVSTAWEQVKPSKEASA